MKKKGMKFAGILLVIALIAVISVGTYAKYFSDLGSKNSTAQVAKWAFETDNASSALTFNLLGTYNANSLQSGKMAPGTNGSFVVSLANTNSEVGVKYNITFDTATLPSTIHLYSDSSFTTELSKNNGNYYYEGYLKKAQASKTITVYWRWEYYVSTSQDSTDTGIGEAADSTVVTATITGTQVDPTTASVGYDE